MLCRANTVCILYLNAMKVQSRVTFSAREWRSPAESLPQFKCDVEFPTRAAFLKFSFVFAVCSIRLTNMVEKDGATR